MSFLSERKEEIINQPHKSSCCRRALINGVLFSKGVMIDGRVTISLEDEIVLSNVASLIKEFFGKDAVPYTSKSGGRRRVLSFTSPACEKYLNSATQNGTVYFVEKCQSCRAAFLRGIFLACGRMSNPDKQYRLEFAPAARTDNLLRFLLDSEMPFSETKRGKENLIYTSKSTVMEDFFAAAAMNSTVFSLMNAKIEGEFKNDANRIANCETNNILKTVAASGRWIEAILALEEANLLSSLPEELEKTARLRLEYRDYSLTRLAAEFTPPISKPGLSHRLNKIVEISQSLLGKNK